MKFWQMITICSDKSGILIKTLSQKKWQEYLHWYENFNYLVGERDRNKLDAIMPTKLIEELLSQYDKVLYETSDNLRSYRFSDDDIMISYFEVYKKYGADILEDVIEKGSMSALNRKKFFYNQHVQ